MNKKKLINLDRNVHVKSIQWKLDMDYIETMKIKAAAGDKESIEGLEFMNSYMAAELDNDFRKLEKVTGVTKPQKKEMTDARNASRRDLYSLKNKALNNSSFELSDDEVLENLINDNPCIGELAEDASTAARMATKIGQGKYYAELREKKRLKIKE